MIAEIDKVSVIYYRPFENFLENRLKMKKQTLLLLALVLFGALQAQKTGSYIDFNVGGGYHNLSYKLQSGTEKGQLGYTVNAGYSFFFTPKWGLRTGLGFQSFNSLSTINYLSSTPEIDIQGAPYTFNANYINWQERQQVQMIDIPLAVLFKQPLTPKIGLLASLGGKISLPVDASYKSNGGELTTTGYYSKWNVPLSDMPQHGFSTMTNTFNGNTTMKTTFMGILDLGALYKLSDKVDLYVGAYLNYGLNNILNPDSRLIFEPNGKEGFYNGMFASSQTSSVTPIAVGLKVGVYIHVGETKQIAISEPKLEPKDSVSTVKPMKSGDTIATILPQDSVQPVIHDSLDKEVTVTGQIPKVVKTSLESPIRTKVGAPVKANSNNESIKSNDPFEIAKRIAESMNVMFGFNSAQVTNSKNELIKQLSAILKANPNIHIRLVGHTCNIGTHKVNKALGMKRAINVKQKFIHQDVPNSQIHTVSMAYDQPLVPNTSKENRAKNRRVEIIVTR